jgi:hypothetical protein
LLNSILVPTGSRSRARTLFYLGLIGLALFELAKVYFIMPMPGSQRIKSLDAAYALHTWRWAFRLVALVAIGAGIRAAFTLRGWGRAVPVLVLLGAAGVGIAANYVLMADRMFKQPEHLVLAPRGANQVDENSVVVGVERDGEAKAWPIRFILYHHQVQDTIGGKPILVTYCNVCRTGRVFEPIVGGQHETFRLVGMDTFNAMFEDTSTGSWWRQATGTAVTGPLKGTSLTEVNSVQLTLRQFLALHPNALVMQPDPTFVSNYDTEGRFERGESRGDLTRTDRGSWNDKSWVIGIERGAESKAYDWNELKARHVINDRVGGTPIVLALSEDGQGFAAFERPADVPAFAVAGPVLVANGRSYDFSGNDVTGAAAALTPIAASQEFWHSWLAFHPATQKAEPADAAATRQ